MASSFHGGCCCFFFFFTLFCNYLTFSEAALVPAMYVFGDSLVDVGNNNYLNFSAAKANFYPNGIDFPTGKPTGRFCNGKNPADFLGKFNSYLKLLNLVSVWSLSFEMLQFYPFVWNLIFILSPSFKMCYIFTVKF